MPAKLFEYIASGRSVLFIGDTAGDAAALLRGRAGCFVREPGDLAGILEALREGLATPEYQRDSESLSRRVRARELAEMLDRVRPAESA